MVIGTITSGLGNQLFQYALARSLALRRNTSLYLDVNYYRQARERDTPRALKLDHFNTAYRALHTSPYHYIAKSTKLLHDRTLKPFVQYVKEGQFQFNPSVFESNARLIILEGFWQSERYFSECSHIIRNELSFNRQTGETFARYQTMIKSADVPVSMHIRRGDYVSHPEFSQSFGFIGLEYYQAAITHLTEQFPKVKLFVFSDDPTWVRQNLNLVVPHVFVTNTGDDADVDDLQLMSLCHHHIIANSSFSWWGAWLNPSPDKRVVAPKQWFRNKPDWNTCDLLPSGWLRL